MITSVLLETPRLLLRTLTLADLDAVAANWKLDEGPISREEARGRITWMLANHRQNGPGTLVHLCLAIIDKGTQGFVGWCGLDHLDPAKANPVLFYLLKTSHRGQGLATEAARAVVAYAFTDLRLARVDAAAAADNIASQRVMEKIGMEYLGLDKEGGHAFTLTRAHYFRNQRCASKGE